MKKTKFSVQEMAFLHCLEEIKETTVGGTTSGILYNFLSKVTIIHLPFYVFDSELELAYDSEAFISTNND
jgi:hypothetical protein